MILSSFQSVKPWMVTEGNASKSSTILRDAWASAASQSLFVPRMSGVGCFLFALINFRSQGSGVRERIAGDPTVSKLEL